MSEVSDVEVVVDEKDGAISGPPPADAKTLKEETCQQFNGDEEVLVIPMLLEISPVTLGNTVFIITYERVA